MSGVVVIRSYEGYKEAVTERMETDAQGRFQFAAATDFVLVQWAHQPVIHQRIAIRHDGKEFTGWSFTKMNYEKNGEAFTDLRFRCDLSQPPQAHRLRPDRSGSYEGVCIIERN